MPPFDQDGAPVSFFEFWPMRAFYPPIVLYAGWLMLRYRGAMLPTVANPSFPGGGFVGESKAEILALAMQHVPEWVAPFLHVDRPEAPSVSIEVELETGGSAANDETLNARDHTGRAQPAAVLHVSRRWSKSSAKVGLMILK